MTHQPTFQEVWIQYERKILYIMALIARRLAKGEKLELEKPRIFLGHMAVSKIVPRGWGKAAADLVFELEGTPEIPNFRLAIYPAQKGSNAWFAWTYGPFRTLEIALARMEEDVDKLAQQISLVLESRLSVKDWAPRKKK